MYNSPCPFTRTMLAALQKSVRPAIELKILDYAPIPERAGDFFIAVQITKEKPSGGPVAFFWFSSLMSIQENLEDFHDYVSFIAKLPSADPIPIPQWRAPYNAR